MFHRNGMFGAPAYPLVTVKDPTGAGDTFAGGFMGYLSASGNYSEAGLRQAIIFGSVMASFNVEEFSLDRMKRLTREEIDSRYHAFKQLTHFEALS
jgi:sugar/nucleoside kinase (ribokinase family)